MLENIKKEVYEANMKLVEYGLVLFTIGNPDVVNTCISLLFTNFGGYFTTLLKVIFPKFTNLGIKTR